MSSLFTLAKDLEQKSKAQQQSTGEMLKAAFSEHEKSVRTELNASAKRISAAISAHEQGVNEAMQSNQRSTLRLVGRTWVTVVTVSVLLIATRGRLENGIYGHSRFCNTDFDDKLACLNLSGV
ncbi:MbeB family mobilization protein (plasmid) [Klebsiella pneumoniae]|nr:MbeB family mobilization protein [Klebsiella pneumoniae]